MEHCFLYLCLLLSLAHRASGVCQITQYAVEQTNRIFTYRDANGVLQLQRAQFVPRGVTLYMYCTEWDVQETQCQDNGQFSVALPMTCNQPMMPAAVKVNDKSCQHTMYIIGYTINNQLLEIYRSCFNARDVEVWYAESDVYYKTFFPRRPFTPFLSDDIFTPAQESSFAKHNIHFTFNQIFGHGQSYVPYHALIINRGHMVACADFLFLDQMSSTFRYLNVLPQFKSINDGNWEKIERWVRSQIPQNNPFRIRTSGVNTLRLPNQAGELKEIFLSEDKIRVPEWFLKVVKNEDKQTLYVFLTYNNIFRNERPDAPTFCRSVLCPLNLPNTPNDGFTYCCDPKDF